MRLVDLGHTNNLLVVSDIHMRHPEDERAQAFCRLLDTLPECDALVLLGDIFDFINARQKFYFNLWRDVFLRLRKLRESGVRVYFIEGNHDYGFEHSPCPEIRECFDFCGDSVLRAQHPEIGGILMFHSDDVVCPPSYRLFRRIVKSRLFQLLLSPIPGIATSYLFSRYAELSRSNDKYRELSKSFLTSCVDSFLQWQEHLQANALGLCVLGHIHVNLDDTRGHVRFVSGPDWFTAPNFLRLEEKGTLSRKWLKPHAEVPGLMTFASREV